MALICDSLKKSGYSNVTECPNGQVAWDYLCDVKNGKAPDDVKCIITDIEMPLIDVCMDISFSNKDDTKLS